ncbi:TPA: hypothetical protein SIA32_003875 [Aeromonas sobria]|nr:hypothetical protein [Aeromonas sobria]
MAINIHYLISDALLKSIMVMHYLQPLDFNVGAIMTDKDALAAGKGGLACSVHQH